MKSYSTHFVILFSLIVLKTYGQEQQLWIGETLSEVIHEKGKWFYQNEESIHEIRQIDSAYFIVDEITQEPLFPIGFKSLRQGLDTLQLKQGLSVRLFVKPHLLTDNNFNFHSFELDIIGESGTIMTKYHLNRFGVFRQSNYKNETVVEKVVSDESLYEFESLFRKIDVRSMNNAQGLRNTCNSHEYSFTFWDIQGKRYNYTALNVRRQLAPIKRLMINLGE